MAPPTPLVPKALLVKTLTSKNRYIFALCDRAGIRLKLSRCALIKDVYYCIRIGKRFVRKKSDFHVCEFLSLEAL